MINVAELINYHALVTNGYLIVADVLINYVFYQFIKTLISHMILHVVLDKSVTKEQIDKIKTILNYSDMKYYDNLAGNFNDIDI